MDKFALEAPMDSVANGAVWLGSVRSTGVKVAVKVIDRQAPRVEAFRKLTERLQTSGVAHDNLSQIFECFILDHYLWIVSDLADLGSAASLLARLSSPNKGFPEEVVLSMMKQVVDGLAFLHAKQWVHRDICGSHVLVCKNGTVRLCFSKDSCPVAEANRDLVGTLTHMAPEVVWGTDYSERCDQWSLGVTFIELLQGFAPNSQLSPPLRIVQAIVHGEPPDLNAAIAARVSAGTLQLIHSLVVKDPASRPTSASVANALIGLRNAQATVMNYFQAFPSSVEHFRAQLGGGGGDVATSQLPPNVYPPKQTGSKDPPLQRSQVTAALAEDVSRGGSSAVDVSTVVAVGSAAARKARKTSATGPDGQVNGAAAAGGGGLTSPTGGPGAPSLTAISSTSNESGNGALNVDPGADGPAVTQKIGKFTVTTTAPAPRVPPFVKQPSFTTTVNSGKFTIQTSHLPDQAPAGGSTPNSLGSVGGVPGGSANTSLSSLPSAAALQATLDAVAADQKETLRLLKDLTLKSGDETRELREQIRLLKQENESLREENGMYRKKLQSLGVNVNGGNGSNAEQSK